MKFKNTEITKMMTGKNPYFYMLKYFFLSKKGKNPQEVKNKKIDLDKFHKNSVILLGHSTVLFNVDNKVILTDPILHTKPVGPLNLVGVKPFNAQHPYSVEDMPSHIDFVIISHNHFDHLDPKTLKSLDSRVTKFLVPFGTKKLLLNQGINKDKVKEFSWEDSVIYDDVELTYLRCRHFTGRGLFDKNTTPWGSWMIESRNKTVFFSGDTGYTKLFKEYGNRFDNVDLALIECGAYSPYWAHIHMSPEESVATSTDLNAKFSIPIHNRKYDLSDHHWLDPIERFEKEANLKNINYKIPELGEVTSF